MPTTTTQFRVATQNVADFGRADMTEPEVRTLVARVLRTLGRGGIAGLQEIGSPGHRRATTVATRAAGWEQTYGAARPDAVDAPVVWDARVWRAVDDGREQMHGNIPGIPSPPRWLVWVLLEHREHGYRLPVVNVHPVAGAWGRPAPKQDERQRQWEQAQQVIQRHVRTLAAAHGRVVLLGDMNRRQGHPGGWVVPAGHGGLHVDAVTRGARLSIDHIYLVGRSADTWSHRPLHTEPTRSDHPLRWAEVTLTAAGADTSPDTAPTTPEETPMSKLTSLRLPARPYDVLTWPDGGRRVDALTAAALMATERRLGYPLTVVQGSYNGGKVAASAGTHDRGGVVDLLAWDWENKVRALRAVGFAAWYRPAIRGLWGAHIHAVLIGHERLAAGAARQVASYRDGRDGLKGNAVDNSWRPDPVPVFRWEDRPDKEAEKEAEKEAAKAQDRQPVALVETRPGQPEAPAQTEKPKSPPYPPKRTLDGIDISHHQGGALDFAKARAAGVRFVYHKATEGDSWSDPRYRQRRGEVRKARIPFGAYHFARPDVGDARREARWFLRHARVAPGDLVPMLDLETTEGLTRRQLTTWVGTWVRAVEDAVGRKPVIYTNQDLDYDHECLLWVARYSNDFRAPRLPKPWERAALWQHGDGVYGEILEVPGIGPCDVNALHPDVPLRALRLPRPRRVVVPAQPEPEPAPPAEPVDSAAPDTPPVAPAPGAEVDITVVRQRLSTAAQALDAVLDSLPRA